MWGGVWELRVWRMSRLCFREGKVLSDFDLSLKIYFVHI
jgi:hypothetical protein